jgi:hypothetical protein
VVHFFESNFYCPESRCDVFDNDQCAAWISVRKSFLTSFFLDGGVWHSF